MIRRFTLAAALAGALTAAGAAAATALPVGTASRGACVAVRDLDVGYCVSNPAPGVPRPRVPDLP